MSLRTRRIPAPPLVILALTLSALTYLLGWSSIFNVERVEIVGAPTSSIKSEIEKLSHIAPGEKLARVNPQSAARKIEKISWVKEVSIGRNWVSGIVTITLTARQPLAFFNSDQRAGQTIDEDGVLFSLPGYTNPELPVISAKSPESALQASGLFTELPGNFRSQITSMVASSSNSFTLYATMSGRDLRIKWGDSQDIALKVSVINSLLTLPENKRIKLIDVVAPHAPIVK